jgi:hypothetical protein
MHPTGDRLKVGDIKGIREEISIPPYHIQGVEIVDIGHILPVDLNPNLELSTLAMDRQLGRRSKISLAVRRVLEKLAKLIPIASGGLNRSSKRLDYQEALLTRFRHRSPGSAPWNNQIITGRIWQQPKGSLQDARTLMHKENLVAHRVTIEVLHGLGWASHTDCAVIVEEHEPASSNRVSTRLYVLSLDEMMPVGRLHPLVMAYVAKSLKLCHSSRRKLVVQQRVDAAEPFLAEQFFGVQAAVRPPELGMPLVGHIT